MADRTSARLFGKIFELLANNPTDENKDIAKEVYSYIDDYDFNEYQMYVDDALIKLDLAYLDPDSDAGIIYKNK